MPDGQQDPRYPRNRPNGDKSMGELDRNIQDLRRDLRDHAGNESAHITREQYNGLVARLDAFTGTVKRLWWTIVIQSALLLLTLVIGAIVAGIIRAVVGQPPVTGPSP